MSRTVEHITPYADSRGKECQIKEMFDNIAPSYDFMNRAMTFGIDKLWRKKAVKMVAAVGGKRILDVATGTGDLAIALSKKIAGSRITGVDLSPEMLAVGRKKITAEGLDDRIDMKEADGTNLPFPDSTFDCVTIAYGIRNFASMYDGYREMYRVLKPGGHLTVVELATPVNRFARRMYDFYSRCLIPLAGRLVSKDRRAYSYLPESIRAVAQRDKMTALIKSAGFDKADFHPMTFGTCIIYNAQK